MPRYFFHRTDGTFDPDREGTELADLTTARIEAVKFAAGTMQEHPEDVWLGSGFRVEVTDEGGILLCTVVILGIDAPAAQELRRPQVINKMINLEA